LEKEWPRRWGITSRPGPQKGDFTVDKASIDYGDARREQDHPHACWDGYVYLGYTDEAGEEQIEKLPCRRCVVAKLGEEA
jgi:hypothetical protein